MFDENKLLKCSNRYNSYKLFDDTGKPLSAEETSCYFKKLGLTDNELENLNAYITENASHSFYDFPHMEYEDYLGYDYFDMFYPANYVSFMRYSSLLITEYSQTKVFDFICPYHEDINSTRCWNIKITGIENYGSYIKCCIYCESVWIDVYMGLNDYGLLISFPQLGKSAMLSLINGYDWYYNQLFKLFNDGIYAESIAESILYLEDLIRSSYNNYK